MKSKKQAILILNIGTLIMLIAPVCAKLLSWPADVIVLGRMLLAVPFLYLFVTFRKKSIVLKDVRTVGVMALLGTMLAWHWVTFFTATKVTSLAVAIITVNTTPIWVTFLEPLFSHERLQKKHIILSLIAFFGIALMVEEFSLDNAVTLGIVYSLIAAILMSLRTIWSTPYVKEYGGGVVMFWQVLFGGLSLLPFISDYPAVLTAKDVSLLFVIAIVGTALSHTILISSLQYLSARTVTLLLSIIPVYGILIGVFLFDEVPSVRILIGGLLIIGIVIVETIDQKKIRL